MIETATQRVLINASPERCFEVATDFESYSDWSSDIRKVDVYERDEHGRATAVRFWAEAMGRTTEFALTYDYSEAPTKLTWHLADGDIERRLDGEYLFTAVDGRTEIEFRLVVELRVPMPGFLKRRAEARILGAALQELKQRAENLQ